MQYVRRNPQTVAWWLHIFFQRRNSLTQKGKTSQTP